MSYLKCLRCVSLLRSATLLLRNGYYLEVGILCRGISESAEDVIFLSAPLGEKGVVSKDQERLVAEFFQEEFDDPAKPATSQLPRDRVKRDQVLAGIARLPNNPLNPSDGKTLTRSLDRGFSGYVHGAYPHLMEIFTAGPGANGEPDLANGEFCVSGGMPWQRIGEMADALASRALLIVVATTIVAKRVKDDAVVKELDPMLDSLSKATESEIGDVNKAARAIKAGKPVEYRRGCGAGGRRA